MVCKDTDRVADADRVGDIAHVVNGCEGDCELESDCETVCVWPDDESKIRNANASLMRFGELEARMDTRAI